MRSRISFGLWVGTSFALVGIVFGCAAEDGSRSDDALKEPEAAASTSESVGETSQSLRTLGGLASTTDVWLEDYCVGPCPAYGLTGDWATVIQAALTSPQCAPYNPADSTTKRRSCTLRTAGAEIRTTQTIHVCRPTRIVGAGRGAGFGNTTLTLASGASIYFHFDGSAFDLPATKCPWNPGQHMTSAGAEISNMTIRRDPSSPLTGSWKAIEAHSTVSLDTLNITGFDQGVLIHGNVVSGLGNANGWRANAVSINVIARRGWEVRGADANAGSATNIAVANTCQGAGAWNESTPDACAGLIDDSFIGNHYAGVSVQYIHDAALGDTNPTAYHPSYWVTSPTTIAYGYEEGNSRKSYFDDNPTLIGGNMAPGKRCNGGSVPPCATNAFCVSQGAGNTCMDIGYRAAYQKGNIFMGPRKDYNISGGELISGDYDANTAWGAEVGVLGSGTNVRFTYDSTYGTWCLRSQGTGAGGSCVTTANAVSQGVSLPKGASWLGKASITGGAGVFVEGGITSVIERLSGPAANPNGNTACRIAGSTYQNTRPAVGETLVWLCRCATGTEQPTAAGACSSGLTWVPLTPVP